jgi:NTE family protein
MTPTQEAPKHRPRIGLVLEGGGALGFAHVGVIRWLEENRIPVDVIAGTSMGGLVGGIYATGKSPAELEAMIQKIQWGAVLAGVTPYRDLSYRRKQDRRDYPNAFEFGLKDGVQFPSGFNSGQQVGLILDEVALPYSNLKSFDDLPIPFRCVATDLVSQQAYVFERGSLSLALRSTMSLPAFFSPIRNDDRVYVDGGLLDNLPTDVAKKMGAELVIAVHLRTKALDPKEPLSSLGVLNRSISVTIAANELRGMEKADILLTADVTDFTSVDYEQFAPIEKKGYEAAEAKKTLLSSLEVSESEWQQVISTRQKKKLPVAIPEFVTVEGTSPYIAKGLERKLAPMVGQPISTSQLDQEMMNITGLGRFSRAGYHLIERNGKTGLEIMAVEKEYAPPTVQPLLFIDGSDIHNVLFSVGARITLLDIGGFRSEWRNDFIAGSEYGVSSEYYHPFNPYTRWFVSPRAFADSAPLNLYEGNQLIASYRDFRGGGGIDIGRILGKTTELRLGYTAAYQNVTRQLGATDLPALGGRLGYTTFSFKVEDFDNPVIPRDGMRIESTFQFYDANLGSTTAFPTEELRIGVAHRTSERSSVLLFASGGTAFTTSDNDVGFPPFSLGGPLRLGAYGANELLTSQYFLFQPTYLYRLKQISPILNANLYIMGMYEIGKSYYEPSSVSRLPQDGTLGLLIQSAFGPILIGGSVGDTGHHKFYFKVGRVF